MRTDSIAPSAPGIPWRSSPPSNAGPAGHDAASTRVPSVTTTSVFVPMSTSRLMPSRSAEADRDEVGADVAADMARDERRADDAAVRVHEQADLVGAPRQPGGIGTALEDRSLRGRLVGHLADRRDVEVEEEVAHRRVRDDHRLVDLVAVDAEREVHVAQRLVEPAPERRAHRARVVALVRDPRHDVAAAEALRVLERASGHDQAGQQVDEPEHDGRRADVDGETEHVRARQVDGDAVVADGMLVARHDGVDLGHRSIARRLEDAHAPADDRELDVEVGRFDMGLAGEAEVRRQVLLGLRALRQRLAARADLDDALAAAARPAARLRHGDRHLVGVVEERAALLGGSTVGAVDDVGHGRSGAVVVMGAGSPERSARVRRAGGGRPTMPREPRRCKRYRPALGRLTGAVRRASEGQSAPPAAGGSSAPWPPSPICVRER